MLATLVSRVDCLVVDEFQDTNPLQFALLWQLAAAGVPTIVVGDLKQAIMGFQGADPRLFDALQVQSAAACEPLTRNWRSQPRLMAFVNAIGPGLFGADYVPLTPQRADSQPVPLEIVFLVDRSGSMAGGSIEEARNALQLCLRSLPAGILFNVVGFGSSFEKLFPRSRPYDEKSLAEASAHVKEMDADLGGTEILPALEAVLAVPAPADAIRQLFILTDGQVSNTDDVLSLAREHAATSRTFTFGIGAGASQHLVKGLARAGGGAAEMIAPGERMEAKVVRQLGRALSPGLGDVRVDWGEAKVRRAPHQTPPVFEGDRVVVFGFLEGKASGEVVLRAKGPRGEVSFAARLETEGAPEGKLLATLAARSLIRDLEEGASPLHTRRGSLRRRTTRNEVQEEVVRLGLAYQLVSRETSFVAVEERENPETGEMTLVKVPIALTRGWGGREVSSGVMYSMASAPAPSRKSSGFGASLILGEPDRAYRKSTHDVSAFRSRSFASGSDDVMGSFEECQESSIRPLDLLVAFQNADGSWTLDEPFAGLIEIPLATIDEALAEVPGDPSLLGRAAATALALAWLERNAANEADEWRLLARKARAWLDASGVLPPGGDWCAFAAATLRG